MLDGTATCDYVDPLSNQRCGCLCWLALVTFGGSAQVKGTGERIWIVLEVTPDENRYMRVTPMGLLEKLAYLGVTLPGVDLDLLGETP